MDDPDISAHRTRTNRAPEPLGYDGHGAPIYAWQIDTPAPLVAAFEAVYESIEDRS